MKTNLEAVKNVRRSIRRWMEEGVGKPSYQNVLDGLYVKLDTLEGFRSPATEEMDA